MKQEDKQYEKWLTELKSRQPIPENPEELTAAILNRITETSSNKKRIKLLAGVWISGIAATLLLFLLINDTYFSPPSPEAEKRHEYVNRQKGFSWPLPENWKEMKLPEKNKYLSSQYAQHRKLRQTQIIQIIKKNQLK